MKLVLALTLVLALARPGFAAAPSWKAGVATTVITPTKSLWMTGFGARTNASAGTLLELNAKALALEDTAGQRAVLVTTDLLGFPATVARNIAARVEKQHGLSRDRLLLNSSHTHGGPALTHPHQMIYGPRATPEQCRDIEDYTRALEDQVVAVIGAALKDLRPAQLSFGQGETEFALNRRRKTDQGYVSFIGNPEGAVDHAVPVLRVDSEETQLRAVVFGYACHPALLANIQQFRRLRGLCPSGGSAASGVWLCLSKAAARVRQHLAAGTVELAQKYGDMLAVAVDKTMMVHREQSVAR